MHKLKYILSTTSELSLPKVLANAQVPHVTVWVDGKKSPLRFPYAEGNHFVTELRHEVMRDFGCAAASEDTHAMNDSRTGRNDCFLCSCVWRQGSRYGVCFENSCLTASFLTVLPWRKLNEPCCRDQMLAGASTTAGALLPKPRRQNRCSASEAPTAEPDLQDVALAFAQGALGSHGAWGGQCFYKAKPIMNYPSIELILPIPRSLYVEDDGSPSTETPSSASVRGGGQFSCVDESIQDSFTGVEVECEEFQKIKQDP